MKKICAALVVSLALSACAEQAPPPAPQVDRIAPPKINLDVQAINLADRSGLQPVSSPYNGNHFSPTILDAVKQWASDRLQASGQNGQAIVIVKDASLISQNLPIQQGVDGWFTRQQGSKYIGRAEVSIEANGPQGFAVTDAVATRAVTLPENPTAVEKQSAYFSLLNGLMKDLGENLEAGIRDHMGSFVIAPPVYGTTASPLPQLSGNDIVSPVLIESPTQPGVPIKAPTVLQAPVTPDQVTPTVMTVSQSPQATPVMALDPSPSPVPVPQPQAPVFGTKSIPNTASMPSSFGLEAEAPQAIAEPISVSAATPAPSAPAVQPLPAPVHSGTPDLADVQAQTLQRTVTIPLSHGPYGQ